jgi:hypothetical protein
VGLRTERRSGVGPGVGEVRGVVQVPFRNLVAPSPS